MKRNFKVLPLTHPEPNMTFVAWYENKTINIAEVQNDKLKPDMHPVKMFSIHDDHFLPCIPTIACRNRLDDILVYQLCGLKKKLLDKFENVFEIDPTAFVPPPAVA